MTVKPPVSVDGRFLSSSARDNAHHLVNADHTTIGDRVNSHRIATLVCGRRTKWVVVVFWLLVFILIQPLSSKLGEVEKNDVESWLPSSAESTDVVKVVQQSQGDDELTAIVVYERQSGITPADTAKATGDITEFRALSGVMGEINGPAPSEDGKALAVAMSVKFDRAHLDELSTTVGQLRDIANADGAGMEAAVAGRASEAADTVDAFSGVDTALLLATLGVVVFVLLFTYRSPILWVLPVITSTVALTGSQAVIYLLAKHSGLVVNGQSNGILTVLVFGAATDYALLLVARYREELRRHEDRHEAMAIALRRAGPAIAASAATVVAGTLCLMIALMNSTRGLGPVAAIGIAVGLGTMITLLPALLVIFGRWIFWPVRPKFGSEEHSSTGVWARIGRTIAKRPRVVWIVTSLVLAAFAVGVVQLRADGLSQADTYVNKTESVRGGELLTAHFTAGQGEPVLVIAKPGGASQVRDAMARDSGLTDVKDPTPGGEYSLIEGTLVDPPDSDAAADTISRVRTAVHGVPGADAKVGGLTAVNLDIRDAAETDRNRIIPLVLIVVLLILCILLRALVAPILLMATVVLSFLTALGASALLFNHVFGFNGADTSMPLLVFVFLVALGIDYNIFLVTRVREESARHGTKQGALIGLTATGGVITSAGLVLAGTFAMLGTLPLVSLAEIGIAVALGVLLDTIIVRSVLVTALTIDVDRWMWWPSKLAAPHSPAPDTMPPAAAAVETPPAETPAPDEAVPGAEPLPNGTVESAREASDRT